MMKKTTFYTLLMAGALALPHPAFSADTVISTQTNASAQADTGLLSRTGQKIRSLFSSETNATIEPAAGTQVTTDANLEAMRRGNDARAARADAKAKADAQAAAQTQQQMEARADAASNATTTMNSDTEAGVNADIQSSTGVNVDDAGVGSRNNSSLGASGGVDLSVGGGGLQ